MGWERKHLCGIASACKALGEDAGREQACRDTFAILYRSAKLLAKGPVDLAATHVDGVVVAVCEACRSFALYGCDGRRRWTDDCPMLAEVFQTP